jgi:hypothetical protein
MLFAILCMFSKTGLLSETGGTESANLCLLATADNKAVAWGMCSGTVELERSMTNPHPQLPSIETATNADLRGSWPALLRAAECARHIAAQTGTAVVVVRNGVLEHDYPKSTSAASGITLPNATR